MSSKRCPDCGSGISVTAQACACGWSIGGKRAAVGLTHPHHARCRVERCSSLVDGEDRLCGQHRALAKGPEEYQRWRDSGVDWRREIAIAWRAKHTNDAWASALRVSAEIAKGRASVDDKRELLDFLRREIPKIGKTARRPLPVIEAEAA